MAGGAILVTVVFLITGHGNRLDIRLHGKLDRESMKAALDDFEAKSAGIEHGVMRYDVASFAFTTAAVFDRAAILADEASIRRFSEWEGKLLPGIRIKSFRRDQEVEAEAWLTTGG